MDTAASGALPNLVVIGAMKCGTTALHRTLNRHPDIAMSAPKELNFFCGTDESSPAGPMGASIEPADGRIWARGNWHRGLSWYTRHFTAEAVVRGESSPGYTSPSHPQVATRMAALIPGARLLYLVRDPVARALSQYRHHQREGTETRSVEEAILDPASQYLSRGRYYERLEPFLAHFPRSQIAVVAHEQLVTERHTLRHVFEWLRVDARQRPRGDLQRRSPADPAAGVPGSLRRRLADLLRDDADRFREWAGRDFPQWTV